MRTIATAALYAMTAVTLAGYARADQYLFTIAAANSVIGADDDLVVSAGIVNPAGEPDTEAKPATGGYIGDADYHFDVRDGAGNKVAESAWAKRLREHSVRLNGGMMYSFPPGKRISENINLSNYFDIPGPGTYLIAVTGYGLQSNTLEVTVLPVGADSTPSESEPAPPASRARSGSGPLQRELGIRIDVDRPVVFIGSQVPVQTQFINLSIGALTFLSFGSVELESRIEIRNSRGDLASEAPLTRERRRIESLYGQPRQAMILAPHGNLAADIDITALYDMSSPGVYTVQFAWPVPESLGGGEIRSNVLTIKVKARRSLGR